NAEDVDLEELWGALRPAYPVSITADELIEEVGGKENLEASLLKREILADAEVAYDKRLEELGESAMGQLQRRVVLSVMGRRCRRGHAPGGSGRERHGPAEAAGGAAGDGPPLARAPLRDGLSQGGHRSAGDGPA